MEKEPNNKPGLWVWAMLVAIVTLAFLGIVLFTDFLGNHFGEAAEQIALVIIAILLIVLLFVTKKRS